MLILLSGGCASTSSQQAQPTLSQAQGVYHEVQRGQTLWRIAKAYGVSLDVIIRQNRLSDATQIQTGQLLFIPGASRTVEIPATAGWESSQTQFLWPVKGTVISFFGSRKDGMVNKGLDIEAAEGTIIVASRPGTVRFLDENFPGYGKTLIIDHGDGYSTVYAHNSEILVGLGDGVGGNAQIARVGKTGRAQRPFLHFEIRKGHEPQNPFYFLP